MNIQTNLAVVFPGQGSQSVGMLDSWLQYPLAQQAIHQAEQALGSELIELIANGPKEQLDLTVNTQPAMLLADVIAYRIWQEQTQLQPRVMAGHSLGEYAALVCAQVLDLTDALKLVKARAQAMQQAVPAGIGAMAAILGLEAGAVEQMCQELTLDNNDNQIVEAVNFNEPNQTVIAGHTQLIAKACEVAKQLGARRALQLPVSGPFHSSLMQPAAKQFYQQLQQITFNSPQTDVINNVDVQIVTDSTAIKDALYRQIFSPVRWTQSIEKMQSLGINSIIECGAGKALTGMNKRINAQLITANVFDQTSLKQAQQLF